MAGSSATANRKTACVVLCTTLSALGQTARHGHALSSCGCPMAPGIMANVKLSTFFNPEVVKR